MTGMHDAVASDLGSALATALAAHTSQDPDFWDFDGGQGRTGGHAFFQYPAMMVPELQRTLLEDLKSVDPSISLVYDPFMGSGTVMLECLRLGLDFYGSDINPMAVLLTYVKAHPPASGRAAELVKATVEDAKERKSAPRHEFLYRDKWFTESVGEGLDRLRASIKSVPDRDDRRFLWVCLAETVRLISNSRTSTVKLHTYTPEQIKGRAKTDPIRSFGLE